jgi:hypothetical protein
MASCFALGLPSILSTNISPSQAQKEFITHFLCATLAPFNFSIFDKHRTVFGFLRTQENYCLRQTNQKI